MPTTNVYALKSRNVSDLMCNLTGQHYPHNTIDYHLSGQPVTVRISRVDGSLLHCSQVGPESLVSVCSDYTLFGIDHCVHDEVAMLVISRSEHNGVRCAVYPSIDAHLSELALRWLLEPMPETLLLALSSGSNPDVDHVTVFDLEPDTFGLQNLALPPNDANSRYRCYGTLKVCDAGVTRLEFLWNADRLYKAHRLNPFCVGAAYPIGSAPGIVFRHDDHAVVFVPETGHRGPNPEYLRGRWSTARNLHADFLAIMSTVAGFTALELNQIAALIGSWWVTTFAGLPPLLDTGTSRRTSLLLTTDMLGRLSEDMRNLLLPLLGAWREYDARLLQLTGWQRFDDMFYPLASFHRHTGIGTHQQLYDSFRVMASQLGVDLPSVPNAGSYAEAFRAIQD